MYADDTQTNVAVSFHWHRIKETSGWKQNVLESNEDETEVTVLGANGGEDSGPFTGCQDLEESTPSLRPHESPTRSRLL